MTDLSHDKGGGKIGQFVEKYLDPSKSPMYEGNEDFQIDVTVLRASNLPNLKTMRGQDRQFYVTIPHTGGKRKKENERETKAIRSVGNAVEWNDKLDGLIILPPFPIVMKLYAEHKIRDILIGTVKVDPVPITEVSFTIVSGYVSNPVIVITIHAHGNHRSALQPTVAFPEPSFETVSSTSLPSAVQPEPPQQIMEDAQVALKGADDAVEKMDVCDEWKETVQNVQWVMQVVKDVADLHPFAKAAWEIISLIPEAFLAQFERDGAVIELVKAMREAFDLTQAEDLLKAIKPNSNQALIFKVMLRHISICSDVIKRYAKDDQFAKRLFNNITGRVSDDIKGLCETLTKLRRDLLDNGIINIQIAIYSIQKSLSIMTNDVLHMAFNASIDDLPYNSGWSSTANKNGCLEGTRADFLEYILEWIKKPASVRGLILFGKAGTGKSSIAYEIATRFCLEDHPASYYSFSRAQKFKQKDHHLLTTIIRDMSEYYPSFKIALGKMIINNTPLRTSDDFDRLFTTLLLEPLQTISVTRIPDLIVIDALDESGDPKKLSAFLSQSLIKLPENFRVLITSRSEGDIENSFLDAQKNLTLPPYEILQMDDPKLAAKIEDDIRLYFQRYLSSEIFLEHGEELVEKAQGLFQWAAVACGYINDPPPGYTDNDCLRGLLGREEADRPYTQELQSTKLYKLYDEVLSGYFTSNVTRPRFRSVMGQLLSAFEPLSINTLTTLRQFSPGDKDNQSVIAVLKFMGSLLSNVTSSNRDLPVVPLHTSFRDFLTDEINKHPLSLDLVTSHKDLTHACLNLMLDPSGLRFNICQIKSSYLPNDKVVNFQIEQFIPPSLFYACRYWDDHLECIPFDEAIFGKLELFFSTKFLFWLEVLSMTKTVSLAVQALTLLTNWLQPGLRVAEPKVADKIKAFLGVVTDAHTFLRCFGKIIATSAPHIYVSALPFAPTSSDIYKTYSSKFPPTLFFNQGQLSHWPALEMSILTPASIKCVAFSPDGQWIASGLTDTTICLWNATTGMLEGTPFRGHGGEVRCVAFSPNGKHIISGSYDTTIRLWNVATGMIEGEPWTGHQYPVNSVAFSPDGRRALSGSGDATICLWDVAKGAMHGHAITGHTDRVHTVAFSPDGEKIVSGSTDHTIRIWKLDPTTGVVEGKPLIFVTPTEVRSVAFSPDGKQIVSGGYSRTIYLWDDLSETAQSTPLMGHAYAVNSVKFSPDGLHIVSGSGDGKICLWNPATKTLVGSPLIGHTQAVRSISFSTDGQRIVSAADDNTIHVWNAAAAKNTVEEGTVAITGHIGTVNSVAFSPVNANQIASGSDDHNVCFWDIETEKIDGLPLTGHTANIHSIKFSSDGRYLISASADNTLRLWNVEQRTMEGKPFTGHTHDVRAVAFSPDAQLIVSGSSDFTVRVWNTASGTMQGSPLAGHSGSVTSVNFSPDGRQVVSGSSDGSIRLWDVETGSSVRHPMHGYNGQIMFVAFSPDGETIVSCARNQVVRVWSARTGGSGGPSLTMGDALTQVAAYALSTDGTRVAGGFVDATVCVWDLSARDQMEKGPLGGHTGFVSSLAFSPDGRRLVSGSVDTTVRVWDVSTDADTTVQSGVSTTGVVEPMPLLPSPAIDPSAINNEGWICGPQGELIVWIPYAHRSTLQRPKDTVAVFAAHQVRLDFSKFVCGEDWYARYTREYLHL